ncbi:hypothetical protein CDAR_5941 [Caerostris darwini]|uniref:Uncharacterized protein n=1 Tax=Caerostris darwini TaxID=1538125 RepID=A0AAV4VRH5_9ARAC|nr:hypothetical protein CDAR_5941 [Caerostris darwini]
MSSHSVTDISAALSSPKRREYPSCHTVLSFLIIICVLLHSGDKIAKGTVFIYVWRDVWVHDDMQAVLFIHLLLKMEKKRKYCNPELVADE